MLCFGGVAWIWGAKGGRELRAIPWETLGGKQGEGEQLATRCEWTG